MSYPVYYCATMIRGCSLTLKLLTEDMTKLNKLKSALSGLTSKVNQGNRYLSSAISTLHSRAGADKKPVFSGETASGHFSALGSVQNDANKYKQIVNNVNQEVDYKMIYLTKRINETNNDLEYWNRELRLAEMEEARENRVKREK